MTKTTVPTDVTLLLPSLADGTPRKTTLQLAGGFARRGVRVDLVVGTAIEGSGPEGTALDVPSAVRLVELRAPRMREVVAPLTRYLRREQPACLLSRVMSANFAAVASRVLSERTMRLVITEDTNLDAQLSRHLMPAHLIPTVRWYYGQADAVVAASDGVAESLRRVGIAAERLRVIPPSRSPVGIDRLVSQYLDLIGRPTRSATTSRRAA